MEASLSTCFDGGSVCPFLLASPRHPDVLLTWTQTSATIRHFLIKGTKAASFRSRISGLLTRTDVLGVACARDPGTCAFTHRRLHALQETSCKQKQRGPVGRFDPPPRTGKCDAGPGPSAPGVYSSFEPSPGRSKASVLLRVDAVKTLR